MNAPFTRGLAAADMRRILALWFPYLPVERIKRQRLGRSWRQRERAGPPEGSCPPLVLSRHESNTQRLAALDERAEALKLKRGMGVAEARAMHPQIEVFEAEPLAERRLLESIADWCDRYTPLVAIDGEDGLFLDISGCAHLFGGERAMLGDLLDRLYSQGFAARAGVASTPGMAWAAARFLDPFPIAPGEEADALAALPLSALRLDPAVCTGLESVGLRMVGAILSAPRAPLARRFGKMLLLRMDQAVGDLEEAVSPRLPVPPLSVEHQLTEPIVTTEAVEAVLCRLVTVLKPELERREEGARRLGLSLFRVDGVVHRLHVGASRPIRDPTSIQRLFRERLAALEGRIEAGFGFELIRLSVLEAGAFEAGQADLDGGSDGDEVDVALFADRVRARLGEDALLRPAMRESHLPERRVALLPYARKKQSVSAGEQTVSVPAAGRPLRLLQPPEPVDVMGAEVPEGAPVHFRWRRTLHRVARAEGPERIAPEWWREEKDAPTRDYFRVEDEVGRRYWLYRQGLYGASREMPRWFMHGVLA